MNNPIVMNLPTDVLKLWDGAVKINTKMLMENGMQ